MAPRSSCPKCHTTLAWYDLIPVFSWLFLRGKCRYCGQPISFLYPLTELITPLCMLPLIFWTPPIHIPAYFIFFSALIVTIRSDLETMLISRFVTLFLIPTGITAAAFELLPISVLESVLGALLGYGSLLLMATLFKLSTGKEGIGQGDLELLAFIGSFIGITGCWFSLLIGSIIGSLCGIVIVSLNKNKRNVKIPFGPFLASGAMAYVLFEELVTYIFLG